MTDKSSTIIIWAHNKPGVFFRILWLFRKKLFNVESATVGYTHVPDVTRFTITISGDHNLVSNMLYQLEKLIDVIKVENPSEKDIITRELILLKLKATKSNNPKLETLKNLGCRILQQLESFWIVEYLGSPEEIDNLLDKLQNFEIIEYVRTGKTAIYKNKK